MTSADYALKSDSRRPIALQPENAPTLRKSFWYQWRAVITATSIISCLALTVLSPSQIAADSAADVAFHLAGWLCFVAAVAIRLWATLYMGGRKGRAVVCEGPYSMCRNPLYIGTLLIALSQVFFFHSAILACGLILPVLVYLCGVVPAEEQYLSQKLGDEYRQYCARVPRWWPRFSQFHTPAVIELNVNGMWQECLRIRGWIWLPFLADAVGVLRTQPWWPQLFNLP